MEYIIPLYILIIIFLFVAFWFLDTTPKQNVNIKIVHNNNNSKTYKVFENI